MIGSPVGWLLKNSLQARRQAAAHVVGGAMIRYMARLQLDRRRRGQVPGDISQNPRQRAQLGYSGLQEGVVTLELPRVHMCVFVWREVGVSISR